MKNIFLLLALFSLLSGCSSHNMKPIATVDYVDLERFMGKWYVIANIPTFIEENAHNAVETYALNADGSIATTFSFYEGSADGELRTYRPTGFVVDRQSNALWGMQFIWPFKAEYRVIYLDEDYQTTIIGRSKRDYLWLMSRQPQIDEQTYTSLLAFIESRGYDASRVQRVPQQWPAEENSRPEHKQSAHSKTEHSQTGERQTP
jgi:apolipoprotein D and lipocalin family protein